MTTEITTATAAVSEKVARPDYFGNQIFGFWIYLMSDMIIFATLFATFGVLGRNYAGGPTGQELFHMSWTLGETLLLLCSSVSFGLVMLAVRENRKTLVLFGMAITFLLGLGFISMESLEFLDMVNKGNGPERSAFLSSFFTLVGTHGTHVTFGMLWMAVMMVQVVLKGFTSHVQSRLFRLSMFWHFLDLIWIGIFTIVYLMGVL
jgi:cytochrome o ubiquinol oxidase subunit III